MNKKTIIGIIAVVLVVIASLVVKVVLDNDLEKQQNKLDETKEEDNTYWYGLEQGVYLMFEPIEYKGDKTKEITEYMILYVDNNYTNHTQINEYAKSLIKANNSELSDKEIIELLMDSLELAYEDKCANNGKGISVCHLTMEDHYEIQIKRLYK